MDPSQDLASSEVEKFDETESGWTTYIGGSPPIYNDDEHSVDFEDYGNNNYKSPHRNNDDFIINRDNNTDDEESDDSMASDAASGPSQHLHLVCINSTEGSHHHGLDFTDQHRENDDNNEEKMIPLTKRAAKQGIRKTRRYEGIVEKEEASLLVADSAASHV